MLQHSVIYRLPQRYRWLAGFSGSKVEAIPSDGVVTDNSLIALQLLSPLDENAWSVLDKFCQALSEIEIDCSVLECEGQPCLLVKPQDECMATCRLKNFGVAIAESFTTPSPPLLA